MSSRLFQMSWGLVLAVFIALPAVAASAQRQSTRSPHGPLNIPCENCHTSTGWTPIRAVPEFNHDSTRYPLRGMHEKVSCTGCHVKPVFTDVGKNCADCHADIHRRQFGANCAQCHSPLGWNVSVQSINNHFNRFPLLGAHAVVECDQCHKNAAAGQFTGLSTNCDSCHIRDWQNTTSPAHAAAPTEFPPSECQRCHLSFDTWLGATVRHDLPPINFPLTQGHASVACEQCHIGGNYNLHVQLNDCGNSQCHLTTWQQTNNPPHASNPTTFPIAQCSTCHTPAGWLTAVVQHAAPPINFPLTQGHANVACEQCHVGGNFHLQIALNDCGNSQCHLTTYNQTNSPPHAANPTTFPITQCSSCHTPAGWLTAVVQHGAPPINFPLTQGHANVACEQCHIGGNFHLQIALNDCGNSNCHLTTWQQTNNPPHASNPTTFPIAQCNVCHSPAGWLTAQVNHSGPPINFPLTQGHANVACEQCHTGGNYQLQIALNDCGNSNCHLTTWQQTNAPPHAANPNSFPIAQCSTCHTTVSWTAAFDHSVTGFALTGMHVSPVPTPCASCHINNNYNLTSAACINCHLDNWNSTANLGGSVPNHITAGFPQDCSICHSTTNWTTSTFNHAATTFGPLTGFHATIDCATAKCHAGPNGYSGNLPITCDGCHHDVYLATATMPGVPNHAALGYQTTCQNCHTTLTWLGALFNHSATRFGALTGAHATIACNLCHTSATPPPLACSGCHMDKWLSTQTLGGQVPNHVAAALVPTSGISLTACANCHNTTAWTGAAFAHSWFNVNHGQAGGVCATCHIVSGDYSQFQCTVCHGNNNAANFHHPNVGGYAYSSPACYQCHSRG